MYRPEMTKLTRRSIVTATGVCASSVISGCISVDDPAVPNRELSFSGVFVEKQADTFHVKVIPKKSSAGPDGWGQFHNVKINAYARSGQLICEKNIGVIEEDQNGKLEPVQLVCKERPTIIAFSASESPCDDDTEIGYATYICENNDCYWYLDGVRKCGEGLPPEVDD